MTARAAALDFSALLEPVLVDLAEAGRPALVARLERAAAARYRAWAAQLPRHASALLECARSEEQIAAAVDRMFPLDAAGTRQLEALAPGALAVFAAPFADLTLREQLALQAAAELQGAAVWRTLAATPGLPQSALDGLADCAAREEQSSARLERILAEWGC